MAVIFCLARHGSVGVPFNHGYALCSRLQHRGRAHCWHVPRVLRWCRRGEVPENYFAFAPPSLQPSAQPQIQQLPPQPQLATAGSPLVPKQQPQPPGPSPCSPAGEATAALGPPTPDKQHALGREQAAATQASLGDSSVASSSGGPAHLLPGSGSPESLQQPASAASLGVGEGAAGAAKPARGLPGAKACEAAGENSSRAVDWKALGLLPVGMTTYTEVGRLGLPWVLG
jgi:hypothetical protein